MKIHFSTRLEAIDWIAEYVEAEGQFEVLREQLNYNFCYHNCYFLVITEQLGEVILLEKS